MLLVDEVPRISTSVESHEGLGACMLGLIRSDSNFIFTSFGVRNPISPYLRSHYRWARKQKYIRMWRPRLEIFEK